MKKQITLLFFLLSAHSFAQDSLKKENKLFINFLPLAMVDYNPTYMFGIEHKLGKKLSLTEEFGYATADQSIYGLLDGIEDQNPFKETYKARLELRKYKKEEKNSLSGSYWASDIFVKQVNDRIERTVGRDCFDAGCAFTEEVNYPVRKNVFTANIKYGYKTNFTLFSDKSRLFLDWSVSLGIRVIDINHKSRPDLAGDLAFDRFFGSGFVWEYGKGSSRNTIPNAMMNFRISYLLK
jgi:hypothetical protein